MFLLKNTKQISNIKKSILYYTLDGYEYINSYLRGENFDNDLMKELDDHIKNIDMCMYNLNKKLIVYRGVTKYPQDGIDPGYISTSKDENVARQHGDYLLIIELPIGIKCCDLKSISSIESENEILVARNSKLIINNIGDNNVFYCKLN